MLADAFNCVAPRGVPAVMAAVLPQEITHCAFAIVTVRGEAAEAANAAVPL